MTLYIVHFSHVRVFGANVFITSRSVHMFVAAKRVVVFMYMYMYVCRLCTISYVLTSHSKRSSVPSERKRTYMYDSLIG